MLFKPLEIEKTALRFNVDLKRFENTGVDGKDLMRFRSKNAL